MKYILLLVFLFEVLAQRCPISGCQVCPDLTQCQTCAPNYEKNERGNCGLYTPIDGCIVYESGGNGCYECEEGKAKKDGKCVGLVPNCARGDDIQQCVECISGYKLVRGQCMSTSKGACPVGTFPRNDYCQPVETNNCANKAENSCLQCQSNFLSINGVCIPQDTPIIECPNCECDGLLYQSKCYLLNLPKCLKSSNGIYCQLCQRGFISIRGLCYRVVKLDDINCNVQEDGICTGCNKYYKLNRNKYCVRDFPVLNCQQSPKFQFVEGECFYNDQHCLVLDLRDYSCVSCQEGYSIVNGFCTKIDKCSSEVEGKCVECFPRFYLDTVSNVCRTLPNLNCIDYNSQLNRCEACSQYTAFTDRVVGVSRVCAFIDNNCLEYNLDGSCVLCPRQTHNLVGRSCLLKAPNCFIYVPDNQQLCQECLQSFHLDPQDSQCYQDQEGCLFYQSGIICKQCGEGYLLVDGKCLFVDEYCIELGDNGWCRRCSNGFLPYERRCVYFDPYCLKYGQDRVCIKAYGGYNTSDAGMSASQKQQYRMFVEEASRAHLIAASEQSSQRTSGLFQANGIIKVLPYANVRGLYVSTWYFLGKVNLCKNSYEQRGDDCLWRGQVTVYNCRSERDDRCVQCNSQFTLVDGRCIYQRANCVRYNVYGLCQECDVGYTLWGGVCHSVQYCKQVSGNYCEECDMGYNYELGHCFMPSVQNCILYNVGRTCERCHPQYFLNQSTNCLLIPDRCIEINEDTGRCLTCSQGNTLYNDECIHQTQYCLTYNLDEVCISCINRNDITTQLMSDNTCAVVPARCVRMGDNKRCAECRRGYSLYPAINPTACVLLRDNCIMYNDFGRCSDCDTNYVLRYGRCELSIENCQERSGDRCLVCLAGYMLTDDGFCAVPDENCVTRIQGVCKQCRPLYHLNGNNFCVKNPQGCVVYNFARSTCLRCEDNYYLVNGRCQFKDGVFNGCKRSIEGFPECLECEQGFTLKDKLCYANDCEGYTDKRDCQSCPVYFRPFVADPRYCTPYFCAMYMSASSFCVQYEPDYQGGHTIAHPSIVTIDFCNNYGSGGQCLNCGNYRYPNPLTQYQLCYPYNCQSNEQYNCQECKKGFGRNGQSEGVCVADFCAEYNRDGTCRRCEEPYTLVAGGTCENQGLCEVFDSIMQVCTECKKYYVLENNACRVANCERESLETLGVCEECKLGYEIFSDGTCRLKFCELELTVELCRRCEPGYIRNNKYGTCQPENCVEYNRKSLFCEKCLPGFFINSAGTCQTQNCLNFEGIMCKQCNENYTLIEDIRCQPANCMELNENIQCMRCNRGYILNTTTYLCQDQVDFCDVLNPITNFCASCIDGFVLNPAKKCIPEVPGCMDYSSFGCRRCRPGYEAIDGKCEVKNCRVVSANPLVCEECELRFELTDNGLCRVKNCEYFSEESWICNSCYGRFDLVNLEYCQTKNCTTLAINGQCLACEEEYQLVDGDCLLRNCKDPMSSYCSECTYGWKRNKEGFCLVRDCAETDFLTGQCTACNHGRRLVNGSCIADNCLLRQSNGLCTTCEKEFYVGNNQMVCIAYFCIKWDPNNGQCFKCAPNFELLGGLCISMLCLSFVDDPNFSLPQCGGCDGNYLPFGQYCVPNFCPPQNYDPYLNHCDSCQFGYIYKNDHCILDNCAKFYDDDTTFSQCERCRVGFSVQTGLCLANNCSAYTPGTIKCERCFDGFYLFEEICLTNNCDDYDDDGMCKNCFNGYQLQANQTCVKYNCLEDSLERCIRCVEGYRVTPSSNGFCEPVNCVIMSQDKSSCRQCYEGLLYDNGICKDIHCANFTDWFECLQCRKGFILNAYGLCVRLEVGFCPPNQYFNSTLQLCTQLPVPNCLFALQQDPEECIQCDEGYFLWENACYSFHGCLTYSYIYGCYACVDGYTLSNRYCSNSDQNCLSSVDGKCSLCKSLYFLNPTGVCEAYPANCLQVLNYNCIQCAQGYQLDGNVCLIPFCEVFSLGVCSACIINYYLNFEGFCIVNPAHCQLADSFGQCINCIEGYKQQGGICYVSTEYCSTYLFGVCSSCVGGYYLSATKSCIILPAFCLSADENGLCVSCTIDYTMVSGVCFKTISYCSLYEKISGNCLFCQDGYYMNSLGLCLKNPTNCIEVYRSGACKTCEDGYKLSDNGLCLYRINDGCVEYDPITHKCLVCQVLHYLGGDGSCRRNPANCQIATQQGICTRCISSYYLGMDTLCYLSITFCASHNLYTHTCQSCITNYYLTSSNICQANPQYCSIVNTDGTCRQCLIGYRIANGICLVMIDYCSMYGGSLCISCQDGYELDGGRCVSVTKYEYCLRSVPGGCSRCIMRYYWGNQYCQAYPAFCVNVDFTGRCLSCCFGSSLVDGRCVANEHRSSNCKQYSSALQQCGECRAGYYYCEMCAVCLPTDPNCVSYSSSGVNKCLACRKGFRKVNGLCINYPTGMVKRDSSFVTCSEGYRQEGSHCYRKREYLKSSDALSSISKVNRTSYIGIETSSPQIIFAIELTGATTAQDYVIQFKNHPNAPFICWNSCLSLKADSNTIQLDYPIIASEVRLYPVQTQTYISVVMQFWIQTSY